MAPKMYVGKECIQIQNIILQYNGLCLSVWSSHLKVLVVRGTFIYLIISSTCLLTCEFNSYVEILFDSEGDKVRMNSEALILC